MTANVYQFTPQADKDRFGCPKCHMSVQAPCGCGVAPVLLKAGELAEAAVKANPEKSDRVIAKKIGVDHKTVSEARRATGENSPVEKRIGADGKARAMPKRSTRYDPAEVVADADEGATAKELSQKYGVVERQIHKVLRDEQIRREAEAKAFENLNIDPTTLSQSAQGKLEAAKRAMEKQLKAEYDRKHAELNETIRQGVLKNTEEHRKTLEEMRLKANDDEIFWRTKLATHDYIFTEDQFKTVLMCLHPDGERSPEKLHVAFMLFNAAKPRLIDTRKKKAKVTK